MRQVDARVHDCNDDVGQARQVRPCAAGVDQVNVVLRSVSAVKSVDDVVKPGARQKNMRIYISDVVYRGLGGAF